MMVTLAEFKEGIARHAAILRRHGLLDDKTFKKSAKAKFQHWNTGKRSMETKMGWVFKK
jgi:hypothetical protein